MHSARFLRRRKFLVVLPLLVVPFLTMTFWALGGGRGRTQEKIRSGLNPELPDAILREEAGLDKLSFYNKAHEDSVKRARDMQNDPFFKMDLDAAVVPLSPRHPYPDKLHPSPYSRSVPDPAEAEIYERLDLLNKALEQPRATKPGEQDEQRIFQRPDAQVGLSADVDRLENLMAFMNERNGDDPEIRELGGMLDKILDIQHPERLKDRVGERSLEKKTEVFPVNAAKKNIVVTHLGQEGGDTANTPLQNRFYEEEGAEQVPERSNAFGAVVHELQTITSGSTVKLRLTDDVLVNGTLIPQGHLVFGIASIEGERVYIRIPGIRYHQELLPVSLAVYDLDGLAGIFMPGSMARDAARQSSDQTIRSIELMSLDPSLKTQAAAAGTQAVKGFLSKKLKQVKLTLKAGYRVLLKETNAPDRSSH